MEKDVRYFQKCLELLPTDYQSADTNRMTLLYFILSGLDLLDSLPPLERRKEIIEWIYSNQTSKKTLTSFIKANGFRGSPFSGNAFNETHQAHTYDPPHLAMTYTALITLLILGDDLSRVRKNDILSSMKSLQLSNGTFLFCACAICYILNDFTSINAPLALSYIQKSQAFDGGFGQAPYQESHGGSTYCALAALTLLSSLSILTIAQHQSCVVWCMNRQKSGFEGRPFKPVDSCYSFWIGASLKMLGCYDVVDIEALQGSLFCSNTKYGGYSKHEHGAYPDLLHSYLGLAGLSISGRKGVRELDCVLNFSVRACEGLKEIHGNENK